MRAARLSIALAFAFGLVTSSLALHQALIDDEGYITFLGALALREQPLAAFFFQKFHPPLSLFYAPVAGLGWRAFLVAHAAFGAFGVFAAGMASSRLGGSGAVASAVLALSPIYLLAAASGQSNSDGITMLLVAIWLASYRERRALQVLAGLTLAAAVWSRYEFALAVALIGLHLALDPKTRWAVAGLAAGPALYLLAGAAYHHDALWWLHFPPTLARPLPGLDVEGIFPRSLSQVVVVLAQLSLVSAAWLLPLGASSASVDPAVRRVRVALLVTLAAMVLVPFARVLNFEHSPRYLAAVLPFTALLAGHWITAPVPTRRRSLALGAILLAALSITLALRPTGLSTGAIVVALLVPLAAWIPTPSVRALLLIAACVGSLVLTERAAPLARHSRAGPHTLAAARWVRDHADGRAIYTNSQHLAMTLAARDPLPPPRYLVAFDIQMELLALLNVRNGQRDAVLRAVSPHLYGEAAWVCEFVRRPPPPGSLFVINHDNRIHHYFPLSLLEQHGRLLVSFGSVRVWQINEGDRGFTPQIDRALELSPDQRDAPCDALGLPSRRVSAP